MKEQNILRIVILTLIISFVFFMTSQAAFFEVHAEKTNPSSSFKPPYGHLSPYDFDQDHRADPVVFKDGKWQVFLSQLSGVSDFVSERFYGTSNDKPIPDYYGKSAIPNESVSPTLAVWRQSVATFHIYGKGSFQWGLTSDKPVSWDYDGDGITDLAVFRTGSWYIIKSSDSNFISVNWGTSGDIPVPGFYFADDAKGDFAVYRPSNHTWYALSSVDHSTFKARQWGLTGDQIVPADYDGDYLTDFAVFRADAGNLGYWHILQSSTDSSTSIQWGLGTDIPVPIDYFGYGKVSPTVFRQNTWYMLRNDGQQIDVTFGDPGSVPVPNILYR